MTRRTFEVAGDGVRIGGWVDGEGTPVLLLHGGPGLTFDYVDGLAADLGAGFELAAYQQRGLAPSSTDGPFTLADHVADLVLVLDELGWDRAVLVGHSWGGHLALHAAVAEPGRVSGLLLVDQMGAVGDARLPEFGAELRRRLSPEDARRVAELDACEERGESTETDAVEGLRLLWPSYFSSVGAAPPMPELRISEACGNGTMASVFEELPSLEAALSSVTAPTVFLVGGASPMPASASTDAADRIDGAWVDILDGVGHFPWVEAPGSTRAALLRLVQVHETGS